MSGDTGGVAGTVRRQLAEGRAAKDIVEELVAGGLSRPSAQRFVDRAMLAPADHARPAAAPEAPATSFPIGLILLAIVAAAGIALAVVVMRPKTDPEAEALAAADREQSERIRAEGAQSLGSAEPDYARYLRAEEQLNSNKPDQQCSAAHTLGQSRSRDYVTPLVNLSRESPHASVRNCAAGALVAIGATQEALQVYYRFSQSLDVDEQILAISGYGTLGPAGVEHSLPYLERALRSEQTQIRVIAVDSLSKIGPLAEPLLEEALKDSNADIRFLAQNGLARLRR